MFIFHQRKYSAKVPKCGVWNPIICQPETVSSTHNLLRISSVVNLEHKIQLFFNATCVLLRVKKKGSTHYYSSNYGTIKEKKNDQVHILGVRESSTNAIAWDMSCFEWENLKKTRVHASWLLWDPTSLPLFVSLSCSVLLWVYFFPSCVQFIITT